MKKLGNCSKAEIFDDEKQLLCTALVELGFQDSLMLTAPRSFDYQKQKTYLIVFYDAVIGLLSCRCELYSPLKKPDDMVSYRCNVLQEISAEQRRMDIKVPLSTSVEITIVGNGSSAQGETYAARMLNISAGGVYITSEQALEEGTRFSFVFRETGAEIPLTAQILRVEDRTKKYGPKLYGYGCSFVRLPSHLEAQLRGYVFQQERYRYRGRR